MFQDHPAWIAHQRARWLRPDAHLFVRPDAYRFMPPGAPRLTGKEAVRYFWPDGASEAHTQTHDHKYDAHLAAARASLLAIKRQVAALAFELKFKRLLREKAYNPNQPRVPVGNPDGGRWTSEGGSEGRIRVAQISEVVTDADGRPYYQRGGHHEMPEAVHKKWNLSPEVRKIFKESSTGPLGATIRTTPDGVRQGNIWDSLHRAYNNAVEELSRRFFVSHNIRPDGSNMTQDHARGLLKEIRLTEDPRIRDFNLNKRRIQRLKRLRGGDD